VSGKRALVVGGGIGGLAAAISLTQQGFEVQVVERRETHEAPGVGLGQPANALRALDALGVYDEVAAAGFPFEHLKVFGPDNELAVDHRFRLGDSRLPAFIALPRIDLHRILLGAAERVRVPIRLALAPRSLARRGEQVEVGFADGTERYDVVLGFDGLRSWTREQVLGPGEAPVFSGYSFWRLIVPRPTEITCMEFHQGLGHKTGVMPLNEDTMYLFHLRPESESLIVDPTKSLDMLRERLADYSGRIGELRDSLSDDDTVVYSPLEPHFVGKPWHVGRVAIGGDAAHAYPPHMTQGAAMALEDAVVLAQELGQTPNVEDALRAYSERRRERCRYVEAFAGRMLHDEQNILTDEDFAAAKESGYGGLDDRLTDSDQIMNQEVL